MNATNKEKKEVIEKITKLTQAQEENGYIIEVQKEIQFSIHSDNNILEDERDESGNGEVYLNTDNEISYYYLCDNKYPKYFIKTHVSGGMGFRPAVYYEEVALQLYLNQLVTKKRSMQRQLKHLSKKIQQLEQLKEE